MKTSLNLKDFTVIVYKNEQAIHEFGANDFEAAVTLFQEECTYFLGFYTEESHTTVKNLEESNGDYKIFLMVNGIK